MGDKPGHKFRGNQWSGGGRGGGGGGADLTVGGMMSRKKTTQAIWDSAKKRAGETDRQVRAREFEFVNRIPEAERTRIRERGQAHRAKKKRMEQYDKDYAATPHYSSSGGGVTVLKGDIPRAKKVKPKVKKRKRPTSNKGLGNALRDAANEGLTYAQFAKKYY